jgi:hypothetical protein
MPTLQATAESLADAGWGDFIVSSDGGPSSGVEVPWAIVRYRFATSRRHGPWPHLLDLVASRLDWPSWEWLLVAQDDVRFARSLRPWLEAHRGWDCPGAALASLWLPTYHAGEGERRGDWWPLPAEDTPLRSYGALALVFSRESAESLASWRGGDGQISRADHWLGMWCRESGLSWLYPARSLCQHTGEGDSTLGDLPRSPLYRLATNPILDCGCVQSWNDRV